LKYLTVYVVDGRKLVKLAAVGLSGFIQLGVVIGFRLGAAGLEGPGSTASGLVMVKKGGRPAMTPPGLNDPALLSGGFASPVPEVPRKRVGRVLRQIWWISVPIWSLGLLSCVPFLAFGVIQRRKRDWVVFAAYLAATVALIIAGALVNTDSGWNDAQAVLVVALGICAAIHAGVLFRPGRAQSPRVSAGRHRNQEAVQIARSRIERRNDARRMVRTNPVLARELRIGRPDLPREYDDGGLIDVNRVHGAVLAAHLGLSPEEATNVLVARDKLGRFANADELCDVTQLSPRRVDELRDLMIFT
jgi:hypothetical protein